MDEPKAALVIWKTVLITVCYWMVYLELDSEEQVQFEVQVQVGACALAVPWIPKRQVWEKQLPYQYGNSGSRWTPEPEVYSKNHLSG